MKQYYRIKYKYVSTNDYKKGVIKTSINKKKYYNISWNLPIKLKQPKEPTRTNFFSHNITETIILLMEKGNTDLWREKLQNEWRVLPNN